MRTIAFFLAAGVIMLTASCSNRSGNSKADPEVAMEMVEFIPYEGNPIFSGTKSGTWDKAIRERGFILEDKGMYKMWFTGYNGIDTAIKYLGYATSDDGIDWTRYPGNPIFSGKWTEDMFVMKNEGKYYMFAEGRNDVAHLLISDNGIDWNEQGDLIILTADGDTIPGPYGTPSAFIQDGTWYLFYERNDEAVWIATSTDLLTWKNLKDQPVLGKGPAKYDSGAVAANQVVKRDGKYYMYYHGSSDPDWDKPGASSIWTSNIAWSTDLLNWKKYAGNPIVEGDHSSPIVVPEGNRYRLYTMHDQVWLYLPHD